VYYTNLIINWRPGKQKKKIKKICITTGFLLSWQEGRIFLGLKGYFELTVPVGEII
jgi:hypothetical protein